MSHFVKCCLIIFHKQLLQNVPFVTVPWRVGEYDWGFHQSWCMYDLLESSYGYLWSSSWIGCCSHDTKSWTWRNIPRRGTYSVLKNVELWTSRECNCILWRLNSRILSAMHTFWSQNGGWLMRWPWHPISLGQRRNVTKYIVSCVPNRHDHFCCHNCLNESHSD